MALPWYSAVEQPKSNQKGIIIPAQGQINQNGIRWGEAQRLIEGLWKRVGAKKLRISGVIETTDNAVSISVNEGPLIQTQAMTMLRNRERSRALSNGQMVNVRITGIQSES